MGDHDDRGGIAGGAVGGGRVAAEVFRERHGAGAADGESTFLLAVALGAGSTVLLATRFGFPVSTTHALAGAMTGAGLAAARDEVQLAKLWDTFGKPLMLSSS